MDASTRDWINYAPFRDATRRNKLLAQGTSTEITPQIQIWPVDRLIFYARNPRKNDAVVDHMCSSIREFGFKVPVLARSDGEVVEDVKDIVLMPLGI